VPFVPVVPILNVDLGKLDHFVVEMSRWSSTIVDEVFDFIVGLIGWNRPEATIVAHFLEGPTQSSSRIMKHENVIIAAVNLVLGM
jgi:hypothetical protein